ncbi:MAG TPA: type VI secretion system tube protein Hcp [Verrucomicrobiae bacterium]|nr:type VI secretion system tube protein Hcp [Verrucomicrobiae bacterium]
MAVDMFIKIGDVEGEAVDHKHKNEVDVLAWSWGMSNSGSAHVGGGAGAGKVNVQDLSFTKYVDKASPKLMLACCNGKHYDQALLTVRKAGEKPVEYIKIKLTEVLITSVSTGGSGGEDRLTENVTLNFAKVHVDYTPQDAKGAAGTAIPMSWDIAANVHE